MTQTNSFIVCDMHHTLWDSAILIRTAQIGYARDPTYELFAPGQAPQAERIANAIRTEEILMKACRDEGIDRDWVKPLDTQGLIPKGRNVPSRL